MFRSEFAGPPPEHPNVTLWSPESTFESSRIILAWWPDQPPVMISRLGETPVTLFDTRHKPLWHGDIALP